METLKFFQQFLHDPHALANGHSLIRNFLESSEANRKQVLSNLFHPQIPIITLISNVYACNIFPFLSKRQKDESLYFLLQEAIRVSDGKIGNGVKEMSCLIRRIQNEAGFEQFIEIYELCVSEVPLLQLGSFLVLILREADDRVAPLSTKIFKFIFQNFDKVGLTTDQFLEICYFCVRSFSHLQGTDTPTLSEYFAPYSSHLLSFIWRNFNSSPKAMKYSLKLLTILFSDFQMIEEQSSQSNIDQIPYFSLPFLHQYLSEATDPHFNHTIEEEEENQFSSQMEAIIFQYLELFDVILSNRQKMNTSIIFYFIILATTPTMRQWKHWKDNSEDYILMAEDEFEMTLRNRCLQLMTNFLEDHPQAHIHSQMLQKYFQTLDSSIRENSTNILQNFIQKQFNIQFQLVDYCPIFEEPLYFILHSCLSIIFNSSQINQFKSYLLQRVNLSSQILVKISSLFICIAQPEPIKSLQFCTFLINLCETHPVPGVFLIASRGLGKSCAQNKLTLGQNIPISFLNNLMIFLYKSENDECVHILLELIIKLTQVCQNNRAILLQVISSETQLYLLNRYFHDGMLANMLIEILIQLPQTQTISNVLDSLMLGNVKDERISSLVVKWYRTKSVILSPQQISMLLKRNQHQINVISSIVKEFISSNIFSSQKLKADTELVFLLNRCIHESWLIYMLKCGILNDPKNFLIKQIQDITYNITSQYELESKMTLPFYMGLSLTNQFVTALLPEGTLFQEFIHKFMKYAQLFKGDHLRVITSFFLFKMLEFDSSLKQKAIKVIEGFGKLEVSEWEEEDEEEVEEEEEEEEEEALIERLIGGKLVNEEMEDELKEVFGEKCWDSESVNKMLIYLSTQ